MNYIDYNFYKNEYCGSMEFTAENFRKCLIKAQSLIDMYTFNRCKNMQNIPSEVKYCCCELIELTEKYQEKVSMQSGISSEKIKNYSVTYESSNNLETQLKESEKQVIYKWLENTGLIYRGC